MPGPDRASVTIEGAFLSSMPFIIRFPVKPGMTEVAERGL